MNISNFSLEFGLNSSEIQKLNKMYFKHLYKERLLLISISVVIVLILLNLSNDNDFVEWIIKSLVVIIFFLLLQYTFVDSVCKITFKLAKKLLESENFANKYRLYFDNSTISVHSPLGRFTHKWCKIEQAILTKDFFFIYIKERNGYIISISNKCSKERNIKELVSFIENNVTHITKV